MAEVPKCYNCGQADVTDLSGTGQLKQMNKMIADHYTVIIISGIIIIVMCFVVYYFVKELIGVFRKYKKAQYEETTIYSATNIDDEVYDDEQVISNTARFYDTNKYEFVKEVERAYSKYNEDKTKALRKELNININDDKIDHSIIYGANDNYNYGTREGQLGFSKAAK